MPGLFLTWNSPCAVETTYNGLFQQQHRGHRSAGMAALRESGMIEKWGLGRLNQVINEAVLVSLAPNATAAIGSVSVVTEQRQSQPAVIKSKFGETAVVMDGNFAEAVAKREELNRGGAIFKSDSQGELLVHHMAHLGDRNISTAFIRALGEMGGAYSILLLNKDKVLAAVDPCGYRPLCFGQRDGAFMFASETCALKMVRAESIRTLQPGEVILIDHQGIQTAQPWPSQKAKHCSFELAYASKANSEVYGDSVHRSQESMGRELARLHPACGDIVVPVPDSGNQAAAGFADESGIPIRFGILRSHYAGRREVKRVELSLKFSCVEDVLKDKNVVIVDESMLQGEVIEHIAKEVRLAGAKEVHVRIAYAPIIRSCPYGVTLAPDDKLIAPGRTTEEIAKELKIDSLGYLDQKSLLSACGEDKGSNYCTDCSRES